MKGNIDSYKEEIISFFKTKHLNVKVVSNEFQSHSYKSQQASVSIIWDGTTFERKALNLNPVDQIVTLAHFELVAMPGCCGILISTNCWTLYRLVGFGIGQFLHQLRLRIAKDWGYTVLMCTDVATNKPQQHILNKNKWELLQQFTNSRTGNKVNIHTILL